MEIYLPTLESKMMAIVVAFRFVVFAIMVAGLIGYASTGRAQGAALFGPLFRAIIIVTAIAFQDTWFPQTENAFLTVADYVDPGYTANPTSSAETIRASTTTNPQGQSWSWRKLNQSIYQAVTNALANVFIYIGTLITVPMLILQYILRWLLYMLTPFALAMFMVPGFSGIAIRFFQQLLAILAWPIGFAITNLVALAVWQDFRNAVGANPQTVGDVLYSPLLTFMGGILATIMIIVGMVSTPIVMQMLFAQGHAFTGSSGNPISMIRGSAGVLYGVGDRLVGRRGRGALLAPQQGPAQPSTPPNPPPMGNDPRPGI
jgi:hypothetical protein